MSEIILGRQPILDANRKLHGYEILYRSTTPGPISAVDGDLATATVMLNTIIELGIDSVVGSQYAWFNMTEETLQQERYAVLPPNRVVLEILESLEPTPENIRSIRRARLNGYCVALDDFVYSEKLIPFLEVADIVKLEFPAIGVDGIAAQVEAVRRFNVRILAEKIETAAEFEACRSVGCDLYQGYFFCKPDVLRSKSLPADTLSLLRLVSRVQDPNVTLAEIEQLIEQNFALSVKVLRLANSPLYSVPRRIESIRHAGVMLGLSNIRTLATLLLVSGMSDKPHELVITGLVRAKLCELLAKSADQESADSYFTVGLLSVIDALMDKPMQEIVAKMSLSDDLIAALVHRTGSIGAALKCAIDCETGDWDPSLLAGYGANTVMNSWMQAIEWANNVASSVDGSAKNNKGSKVEAPTGGNSPATK
jgi:c-di-GMP phosphodiesterase